jgi:hypothetical protein
VVVQSSRDGANRVAALSRNDSDAQRLPGLGVDLFVELVVELPGAALDPVVGEFAGWGDG